MVAENNLGNSEKIWVKFLRKHWMIVFIFVLAAALAFVGAIYVFLWFVGKAQLTGLVPAILNLWAVGHFVTFLLHLIFWEVLYIGIPIIVAVAITYFLWWKRLPLEEREEYKRRNLFGKSSHRSDASGGISFLVFIAFLIKVYLDGNWNVAIASWKFDYLVYSWLLALFWVLIIFGIPLALGGLLWIRHEMKNAP